MGSKRSSQRRTRNGSTSGSANISRKLSASGAKPAGTALLINPMDPRATPRVQVRERSPTPPPPNAKTLWFQFEVEDTGPGIPEALQQRVFEPFVQGDLGLSRKYGGTGLGLSICSQLAGLMGGTISLVSREGEGTTFKMEIPLKFVKERTASLSSSDAFTSRPNSFSSRREEALSPKPLDSNPSGGYVKGQQPRLVGLSQPFFASQSTPSPPSEEDTKDQLAALDRVAKETDVKIRVLVAEDNLVNQEVVLR